MTSRTFNALANEAGLAAGHLMAGVTALGKANYAEKAYYYQAFFSLSTGFERTCKLIFLCDYFSRNSNTFPSENLIRGFGHNLQELLDHVGALPGASNLHFLVPGATIHKEMIRILSTFATNGTRYYNIDAVLGKTVTYEDPLADWYKNVVRPCWEAFVSPSTKEKVDNNAKIVGILLEETALVRFTSEEGHLLDKVYTASLRTGIWEQSAPYVRLHALQWCRFAGEIIDSYSNTHEDIPVFSDFYGRFFNEDSYLKSRKTWSLQGR